MKHSTYTSYDDLPLMLSVAEVASVLGISRAGAYELVRSSGFPALKIGSRIIVPRDKFLAWIDANSDPKNAPLYSKKNPLYCKRKLSKPNNNFFSLYFDTAMPSETRWCSTRTGSRGSAALRGRGAFGTDTRIVRASVPKALCFFQQPLDPCKNGKVCPLTSARTEVPDHAARVEGTDTTPI